MQLDEEFAPEATFGESTHYIEPRSWYTQDGDEETAGGYERRYKRYRTPREGGW